MKKKTDSLSSLSEVKKEIFKNLKKARPLKKITMPMIGYSSDLPVIWKF